MYIRPDTESCGFNSIQAELANVAEMLLGKTLTMTPLPVMNQNTSLRVTYYVT